MTVVIQAVKGMGPKYSNGGADEDIVSSRVLEKWQSSSFLGGWTWEESNESQDPGTGNCMNGSIILGKRDPEMIEV